MKKKDKAISSSSQRKKEIIDHLKKVEEEDYFLFIHCPANESKENYVIYYSLLTIEAINMCANLIAYLSRGK